MSPVRHARRGARESARAGGLPRLGAGRAAGGGALTMLSLADVHAFYGKSHILNGVQFEVGAGEIVGLLGRNGSGRSTTVKAIMGLVHAEGSIRWRDQPILGRPAFEIAYLGIGYVPENRDIFPKLTVHQNLVLGQKRGRGKPRWGFDDAYARLPRLAERRKDRKSV